MIGPEFELSQILDLSIFRYTPSVIYLIHPCIDEIQSVILVRQDRRRWHTQMTPPLEIVQERLSYIACS